MNDLKIVVEGIKGFCDLPMQVGDYFEVKGGKIIIPPGKHMCFWALQSLMPFFPVKQRNITEENDWMPYTKRINCPDPNGGVIYRIDIVGEEKEESVVRKRILVNKDKCNGCMDCVNVCPTNAVRIESTGEKPLFKPLICRQCGNAACMNACPVGALTKDPETQAILVNEETCIGCNRCEKACPFHSITFSPEGKAVICDLCGGTAPCTEKCPTGALVYGRGGGVL